MWTNDKGQIRNGEGWVVASVPYTLGGGEDARNARLIAAAPELLEQLKALAVWCESKGAYPITQEAHKIINKIKGE